MGYKTDITKQFKSKGFIDGLTLISSEKSDAGAEYDIQEILAKIGKDGNEVDFSVKIKETVDAVEEE